MKTFFILFDQEPTYLLIKNSQTNKQSWAEAAAFIFLSIQPVTCIPGRQGLTFQTKTG